MDVYYDSEQNIWFGPAMNRAYYLEDKISQYPRVIIDPDFAENLAAYNEHKYGGCSYNGKILKKDSDGLYYIHHLNLYQLGIDAIKNEDLAENILALCKAEMEKPRDTEDLRESIRKKYKWLEQYILESKPDNYSPFL